MFGDNPEIIEADKIYATNENRKWCKERNIRLTATPKSKPVKKSAYQKAKVKKEYAENIDIMVVDFVDSKFKEARDENGLFLDLSKSDLLNVIEEESVYDIETNKIITIKELNL